MKQAILLFLLLAHIHVNAQERAFVIKRREAKDHVALVIGNSSYPEAPLANPKNDATDVTAKFRKMGFVTDLVMDADKEEMALAIQKFESRLTTAKAAIFYYAGHGMQVNGQNYLIPIGRTPSTQISTEAQVTTRAINVGEVMNILESAQVNFSFVVLDACRNNPLKGAGRGRVPGLAAIDAPLGSLVMYATKAGATASDGAGERNSPFTASFLEHISTPGLDVNILPSKITASVNKRTNQQQVPGSYMQLTRSFTLVPEISVQELLTMKKGELNNLQELEIELAQQKEAEDALIQVKQEELDVLNAQIASIKQNTGSATSVDLDEILAIVERREKQQAELEKIERQAELKRLERESVLREMKEKSFRDKQAKLDEDFVKYDRIAFSEFGKEMAQAAWDAILVKWGKPKGSIVKGDKEKLNELINFDPNVYSKPSKTIGVAGTDMKFVKVLAGTFLMGSMSNIADDEKPIMNVLISKDYYMGKYEVTQAEWREIMGSNPSKFNGCDNCPVEQVSWDDVQEFIIKLKEKTGKGFRLPTEAEWEYAARGGQDGEYAGSNDIGEVAWDRSNSGNKTHAVGQKNPNRFGLYDMSGNVWEWCSDWYGAYSSSFQTDPTGPSSGFKYVLRGGGWGGSASHCRAANRYKYYPTSKDNNLGFRLVYLP